MSELEAVARTQMAPTRPQVPQRRLGRSAERL